MVELDSKRKRFQDNAGSRPTLGDVARLAGVSSATVSRCLSHPAKVRPGLRQRVETAIAELGYTPHGAARALASQRSNTLGAVIPTLDNAIFASVLQHFQERLSAHGRSLLLATSEFDPAHERQQIENLIVRGVDGLMLTGETRAPEAYDLIRRRGLRYVNTYVYHPGSPHPLIGFDNRAAMERVVAHLYDLGHRSFAMIAGIGENNDRAAERIAGTREALRRRGLGLAPERVLQRPYSLAAGREALKTLLAQPERPSAIVCGIDVQAVGALLEAQASGLSVPGDLSITGFDDLDIAGEIPPGLTTIHAPMAEMGRGAADFLCAEAAAEDAPMKIELPAELVVRGSTGPVG